MATLNMNKQSLDRPEPVGAAYLIIDLGSSDPLIYTCADQDSASSWFHVLSFDIGEYIGNSLCHKEQVTAIELHRLNIDQSETD